MKKITLLIIIFIGCNDASAQHLGYGALFGFNFYDLEIDGPIIADGADSGLNVGGFVEYQLNNRFGVRGSLIYISIKEGKYDITSNQGVSLFDEAKIKSLQIHTLLKYDVSKVYHKGFYFIGGFRMTNVLNVTIDGEKNDDFYKKVNYGGMLGFGVNSAKHFGIEMLPEVNLTNTLQSKDNKARNYGVYLSFTANIESIIK
ncbi:MAG TPA: porin family protein [Flavobacterium sp.]|jgi:hypothetical protein